MGGVSPPRVAPPSVDVGAPTSGTRRRRCCRPVRPRPLRSVLSAFFGVPRVPPLAGGRVMLPTRASVTVGSTWWDEHGGMSRAGGSRLAWPACGSRPGFRARGILARRIPCSRAGPLPAYPDRGGRLRKQRRGRHDSQPVARRLVVGGAQRDRSTIGSYRRTLATPIRWWWPSASPRRSWPRRVWQQPAMTACAPACRAPRLLDRVNELLEQGVIAPPSCNAAGLPIPPSTACWRAWTMCARSGRPARLEHARRVAPGYPGRLPRVFPPAWLPA